MSRIAKWRQRHDQETGGRDRWRDTKDRSIAGLTPPSSLPAAIRTKSIRVDDVLDLGVFDDLQPDQALMITPSGASQDQVYTVSIDPISGEQVVVATDAGIIATTGDGSPPASSPTPTITQGIAMLVARWTAVANADPVTYEVHISDTTGFTPDGTTLLSETPADAVVIRTLPDDTPIDYDTFYYVKIIAKDVDGAAAPSAEGSGFAVQVSGPDIAVDSILANHIVAGEITGDKLASIMAVVSALVAGNLGANRVEVGYGTDENGDLDISFIGIRAFDTDGATVTFSVDDSGNVYVRGVVDWGSDSTLQSDNIIQMQQRGAATGYLTPTFGTTQANHELNATTVAWTFPQPSANGQLPIVIVQACRHSGSGVPTVSGSAGWVLVDEISIGSNTRLQMWAGTTLTKHTGITLTASAASDWGLLAIWVNNVEVTVDKKNHNSGSGDTFTTGSTGALTQTDEFALAVYGIEDTTGINLNSVDSGFDTDIYNTVQVYANAFFSPDIAGGFQYATKLTSATTALNPTAVNQNSADWGALIATFKAKSATLNPESPGTGKINVFAKERDDSATTGLYVQDNAGTVFGLIENGVVGVATQGAAESPTNTTYNNTYVATARAFIPNYKAMYDAGWRLQASLKVFLNNSGGGNTTFARIAVRTVTDGDAAGTLTGTESSGAELSHVGSTGHYKASGWTTLTGTPSRTHGVVQVEMKVSAGTGSVQLADVVLRWIRS